MTELFGLGLFGLGLGLFGSVFGLRLIMPTANLEPPVFQRMYICLDACKKGFMAGCRKVLGLDGCFFKGAMNG